MLRIVDGRNGEPVELDPGRRTPLRVLAHTGAAGGTAALRVLLLADVLARTAETYGGQVLVASVGPADPALDAAAAALGIKPREARGDTGREAEEALAGPARVHVAPADTDTGGPRLDVGPVHPFDVAAPGPAVRLALLRLDRRAPAELTPRALEAAEDGLRHWRGAVARWAESPSKPMCAEYVERIQAALRADLDTVACLAALDRLEEETALPDGSRFETFARADRVLALELTGEVGGVRS
ncbi:hypothetical protein OIE69_09290 [Actinacidiphila glaucinigra]|uniref:hypothetical protein n=1 Tax=Actinacidiphila glaucinigra TaxID=235986 RepID=UPI002DD9EEF7|nr:hypothetical protein [Actinacidiphila glaucinigra]WSD59087.1 hypothetical protein OIE69_09290 [Actinacidiphila glaucinigra]